MFEFTVKPDQGDAFDVAATTRDVVAWERGGKNRSFSQLANDVRMGDMYALAYTAAKRQGLFDGTLADFETSVDLEFAETDEPDPTRPGASPGD